MAAKLVLAVAAVLLCLQLAAAQKMIETPQPLFAWSSAPGSVSTEQRTISLAKLTLEGIVLRLVGRAELDLGVVYLIPQLRTDRMRDGALPAVKAAVRGAQSSLILPYTTGSGITALLNLDATRFLLFGEPIEGLEASPLASLDDVKNAISQLGRNQQREVIVIELPLDLDQADAIIADVEAALQADANSYVSFLTVSEPAEQVELNFPANPTRRTRSVQLTSVNEGNANVADTPPVVYTNRWPAGVITGLLLGAMTLFFLIIGFLATMDVQSPERFESSEKKQRSSS